MSESTGLTQVVRRSASSLRIERGLEPVFEFRLEPHERIVGTFHYWTADYQDRKTVDHHIIVWVAVTL